MRSSASSPLTPGRLAHAAAAPSTPAPALRAQVFSAAPMSRVLRHLPGSERHRLMQALQSSNALQPAALHAVVDELVRPEAALPADQDLPAALLSALASALARVGDDQQRNPQLVALLSACDVMPQRHQDQIMAALLSGAAGSDVGHQAVLLDVVTAHLATLEQPARARALRDHLAASLPTLHPDVFWQA